MIKNIPIEKLHANVDNPRKAVGDVSELAESIKQNGVLQNLTVVPATGYYHGEEEYTVIIGHRRLAAAKLAGLTELPCAVVEMDKKEQVATMLLENMQRSDLTVYEEAQGMQMMMDLGESIENISERTGMSPSTIRRRVKLLSLDEDKFRESESRQISLTEYEKLFEIENEEKRNELLEHLGTANFDSKFLSAKRDEEQKKKQQKWIEKLEKFAEKTDDTAGLKYEGYIYYESDIPTDPEEREEVQYYYTTAYGSISLYREYTDEEIAEREANRKEREKEDRRRAKMDRIRDEFADLEERAYELRLNFIKTCPDLKKKQKEIAELTVYCLLKNRSYASIDLLNELFDKDVKEESSPSWNPRIDYSKIKEDLDSDTLRTMLFAVYSVSGDKASEGCHTYECTYTENEELKELYRLLGNLGYEMSDEEKQMMDGTHELYIKEKESKNE